MFFITTDSLENTSKEYSYNRVKNMIERQKGKYWWEFIFLGANIDAAAEAVKFGISEDRAANFNCDSEGTRLNYAVVSETVSYMRKNSSVPLEWNEKIDKDFGDRKININLYINKSLIIRWHKKVPPYFHFIKSYCE